MSTPLCEKCTSLREWGMFKNIWEELDDWRSPEEEYGIINLGLLEELTERSEDCTFCKLILDTVSAYLLDRHGEDWDQQTWYLQLRLTHPSLYFNEQIHADDDDCFSSRGYRVIVSNEEIQVSDQSGQPAVYFLPLKADPEGTDSDERIFAGRRIGAVEPDWDVLKSWSSTCHASHNKTCEAGSLVRGNTNGFQGLQVIDVFQRKVVDGQPDCSYVCLSYVWGYTIDVATLYKNYEARQLADKLPQTLEDAMLATKRLGEQYLWIDSLCIDQFDAAKKQEQINNMHVIFSQAKTTLIAAASPNLDSGIPGVRRNSRSVRQFSAEVDGVSLVSIPLSAENSLTESTWTTRGWTLQESALARCCLIFCKSEVFFQCNRMRYRESVAEPNVSGKQVRIRYDDMDLMGRHWSTEMFGSTPLAADLAKYSRAVRDYLGRNLTSESDMAAAFRGTENVFVDQLDRKITNGLPHIHRSLALSLFWVRGRCGPRLYRFPSWSWTGWSRRHTPDDVKRSIYYPPEQFMFLSTNLSLDQVAEVESGEGVISLGTEPEDCFATPSAAQTPPSSKRVTPLQLKVTAEFASIPLAKTKVDPAETMISNQQTSLSGELWPFLSPLNAKASRTLDLKKDECRVHWNLSEKEILSIDESTIHAVCIAQTPKLPGAQRYAACLAVQAVEVEEVEDRDEEEGENDGEDGDEDDDGEDDGSEDGEDDGSEDEDADTDDDDDEDGDEDGDGGASVDTDGGASLDADEDGDNDESEDRDDDGDDDNNDDDRDDDGGEDADEDDDGSEDGDEESDEEEGGSKFNAGIESGIIYTRVGIILYPLKEWKKLAREVKQLRLG